MMKMIVVVGEVEVPRTPRGQVQVLAPPYIESTLAFFALSSRH